MIVSDPNKGKAVLKENGITAMLTDVIALRVPHETGSLSRAMHQIVDGDVNIDICMLLQTEKMPLRF